MIDQWNGCYDQGWGKNLVPEAFSHPAKVSFSLAAKIYDHVINEGWVKKGDLILDPFSGIGGFAFHALCYGLNFIGVELEQKFVDLGQQNIELWNRKMKGWPNLGMATIIQGDSRKIVAELWFQEFKDVIEGANLILSSPPYADWHGDDKRFGILRHKDGCKCNFCKKNKGNMGFNQGYQDVIEKADLVVSSPPFSKQAPTIKMDDEHIRQLVERTNKRYGRTKITFEGVKKNIEDSQTKIGDYGHTPGNLANLKEWRFDLVCGSPPYAGSMNSEKSGIDWSKGKRENGTPRDRSKEAFYERMVGAGAEMRYGQSPGQLGAMKEGSIDAVISSPPYVDSVKGEHEEKETASESRSKRKTKGGSLGQSQRFGGYGKSLSQLGSMKEGGFDAVVGSPPWDEGSQTPKFECKPQSPKHQGGPQWGPQYEKQQTLGKGDTFWSASKIIVQQCYELLKPSGISIWVCKDYIKGGRRIPFSQRWATLCESVGFELIHWHKASLIKEFGTQITTMNGDEKIRSEKKSFFRRLAEKKGSPRIDEEDILCLIKPLAEGK